MSNKAKLTYESALRELQQIVATLQEETVNIDDLADKIRRAKELIEFCREKLRNTEAEAEELFKEK